MALKDENNGNQDNSWLGTTSDGTNNTGYTPTTTLWRGGSRGDNWVPPAYLQTYGNYTGLFPSMGEQVGRALYGSIQGGAYQPVWTQNFLPPRLNATRDMSKYSPFQSGIRQMTNPYPLNGKVNFTTPEVGGVLNWSNPFIGPYSGLYNGPPGNGGGAGPGTGTTPIIGTGGTGGVPVPTTSPTPQPVPPPPIIGTGGTGLPPPTTTTTPTPIYEPQPMPTPTPDPYVLPGIGGTPYTGGTGGGITEPAPGSGYPATTTQALQKMMSSISPQMLQGLLGYFGGLK